MRFLIVEDEEADADMLMRFLTPYASSFRVVKTLAEAFTLCQNPRQFTVGILDLTLADSSWKETLNSIREIRRLQPDMRLIVCSGMPVPELREQAITAGADVFLPKDQNLFKGGGKALLIAVNVAMLHATPNESFMPHVLSLRQMVSHLSEDKGC